MGTKNRERDDMMLVRYCIHIHIHMLIELEGVGVVERKSCHGRAGV